MNRFFVVMAAGLSVSCSETPSRAANGNTASTPVAGALPAVFPVTAVATPAAATRPPAGASASAPAKAAPAVKKAEKKPEPPPTTEATRDEQRILSTETVL